MLAPAFTAAQSKTPETVEFTEHTAHFAKKIYPAAGNVYSAVGWAPANSILIDGDEGAIVVDTTDNARAAGEILAEFRRVTSKPIVAVIYTHHHADHIQGVRGFVTPEDVRGGRVQIIAHEDLLGLALQQVPAAPLNPVAGARNAYTFWLLTTSEERQGFSLGTGPLFTPGPVGFIPPTRTFRDQLKVTIAGVDLELVHVPSEAPDEIAIFLPKGGILLSAEVLQGPAFPNLYAIRGGVRNLMQWAKSIDRMRQYGADSLVPSHGEPIYGRERVEEILRSYRDAIQFVHDQTVRHMNHGLNPDELVQVVQLPPHLAGVRPYLREYYGTVRQAVRQVYASSLGWFTGDPVTLDPLPPRENARRHVELMGGRARVLRAAQTALQAGEAQWAAELTTYLVALSSDDREARQTKAGAYRQLAAHTINSNWRSWYLSAARELDGSVDPARLTRGLAEGGNADLTALVPACAWIEAFTTRLKAESTLDVHLTVGFRFTDGQEECALEIRRGVAQFHVGMPKTHDLVMALDRRTLESILKGSTGLREAVASGALRVEAGEAGDVERFFGYFEQPFEVPIRLTVR